MPLDDVAGSIEYANFLCYQKGDRSSYGRAFQLYLRAAEVLDIESMMRLHALLKKGLGVKQDVIAGAGWANKAVSIVAGISPSDARGYLRRAQLWQCAQQPVAACNDLNMALKMNRLVAGAEKQLAEAGIYKQRAFCQFSCGDAESALADFRRALQLNPDDQGVFYTMALCNLACFRPLDFLKCYEQICIHEPDPGGTRLYAAIYGALACRMQKDERRAKQMICEARKQAVRDDYWPYPLIHYLDGELKDHELLELSQGEDQLTESRTIIALNEITRGDLNRARSVLQLVRDEGNKRFFEHDLAVCILNRLNCRGFVLEGSCSCSLIPFACPRLPPIPATSVGTKLCSITGSCRLICGNVGACGGAGGGDGGRGGGGGGRTGAATGGGAGSS